MDDVGAAPKTEGKGYLETRFSISGPEAIDRLHRQDDAELFSLQLAQRYPGAFLGMEIQHSPTYRIVLSMGSNEFDPAIRQEIPPSLKPYVQIRRSRMSKPEAEAYRIALITALSGQRISLAFDYTRDRFIVTAPEAKRAEINKLIPADLKALVDLQFGQTPSAFQTNATSADTLTAGWLHYGISGPSYYCTFAFTARDSQGRQSLLTAEHCQSSVSETRNNNQSAGNKVITFGQPLNSNYRRYEYNSGLSRSYDFRLIPAPIVSSGAWV